LSCGCVRVPRGLAMACAGDPAHCPDHGTQVRVEIAQARALDREDLERQIALDDAVVLAFVLPLVLALWVVFS
ncbi:MAG TPA: hypothetical protein VIV57_20900, partial [Anaeromyxobacter sp.]